jgi:hypothetical protein
MRLHLEFFGKEFDMRLGDAPRPPKEPSVAPVLPPMSLELARARVILSKRPPTTSRTPATYQREAERYMRAQEQAGEKRSSVLNFL